MWLEITRGLWCIALRMKSHAHILPHFKRIRPYARPEPHTHLRWGDTCLLAHRMHRLLNHTRR
jgi:hypothetical protein